MEKQGQMALFFLSNLWIFDYNILINQFFSLQRQQYILISIWVVKKNTPPAFLICLS